MNYNTKFATKLYYVVTEPKNKLLHSGQPNKSIGNMLVAREATRHELIEPPTIGIVFKSVFLFVFFLLRTHLIWMPLNWFWFSRRSRRFPSTWLSAGSEQVSVSGLTRRSIVCVLRWKMCPKTVCVDVLILGRWLSVTRIHYCFVSN